MKKTLLICSLFLLGMTFTNATNLAVGDIAISSANSDDSDDFSFVLLTPISGTTTIYFTDNGWDDDADGGGANPTWRGTTEGTITWTFTGSLTCGTQVQITTPTGVASHGTVVKTGSFNMSSSNDHLLAYTGTGVPNDGTEITNFITAFGIGSAGWTSDASTTTTSALPPGLTDGVNAMTTLSSDDNFQYDCSTVSPVAALRTALVTPANFTSGTTNENYQGPACAYSCGAGCTDPDVPTVTHSPTTVCDGSTTTLTITGNLNDASKWYIYTGSCGGTIVDSTASGTFVVTPTGPTTTYFVRGEGNCVTPGSCGSTVVTVTPLPSVTFTALSDLCIDAGVQTGLGGATPIGGVYSGSGVTDDGNGQTYSFDPAAAGVGTHTITYSVTASGCSNNATDDVEVFALPSVTFTAPSDLCVDAGVQSGLGGATPIGGVYSGSGVTDDGNGQTYSFDPAAAGVGMHTLTYTFSNVNGCTNNSTDDINVNPTIDNTVTNTSPTLTANQSGATYRWLDCNNSYAVIPSETNQAFTASSVGSYAVEITMGSCIDTSACENVLTTGIISNNIFSNVTIYPNPTKDVINVSNVIINTKITLLSVDGKIIYQESNIIDSNVSINLNKNSKGIYFLKVETNGEHNIYKIIKN